MILNKLKTAAESLPYSVGRVAITAPFSWRLGSEYTKSCATIRHYEGLEPEQQLSWMLDRLDGIVTFAQSTIPFYQDLYGSDPIRIRSLEDFEALPTISKVQVRAYTKEATGAMLLNTGGTSVEPLNFYVDGNAWAREWAHMHYAWDAAGHRNSDLKLTILGKNLGSRIFRYNAVHHEFRLNPYKNAATHSTEIMGLFAKYPIRYLHGYPSSIYSFLREIESSISEQQKSAIQSTIKACLLSSEFPIEYMRNYLRESWGFDFLSWYGHSEMCIFAVGRLNEVAYHPLLTYGYAEAVDGQLHGTSFNNLDMPLIRYNTGDGVESTYNAAGLIDLFSISEGRVGDYAVDRNGRSLTLTALVYGRHHRIFEFADFVQIFQPARGKLVFYIVLKSEINSGSFDCREHFDLADADFEFSFSVVDRPFRTRAGKLKLLLSQDDLSHWNSVPEA